MAWILEYSPDIPRDLKGTRFGELWKYRVGYWRIIAKIEDARLVILIVGIGHCREVYR